MNQIKIGTSVTVKETQMRKFYKNSLCIIDKIENYGDIVCYRLKFKDSFSWYSRKDFKITI